MPSQMLAERQKYLLTIGDSKFGNVNRNIPSTCVSVSCHLKVFRSTLNIYKSSFLSPVEPSTYFLAQYNLVSYIVQSPVS